MILGRRFKVKRSGQWTPSGEITVSAKGAIENHEERLRSLADRIDHIEAVNRSRVEIGDVVYLKEPEVSLHRAGTEPAFVEPESVPASFQQSCFYYPCRTFVTPGRWYAQMGDQRFLGKPISEIGSESRNEGFATPAAAEKAAREWWKSLPTVRAK